MNITDFLKLKNRYLRQVFYDTSTFSLVYIYLKLLTIHASTLIGIQSYHITLMSIQHVKYMDQLVIFTVFRPVCTKNEQAPETESNSKLFKLSINQCTWLFPILLSI